MSNAIDYSHYNLEYRSAADDAWYNALVLLNDDTLTVKLQTFPDSCDETFNAGKFKTVEDVDEFVKRFRPVSDQVQDADCSIITKGMTFCATLVNGDDIRYYDAIVDDVCKKEHVFNKKAEEECSCEFLLCWQHGPKRGTITPPCNIQGICQIQSCSEIDHRVATFSKMVKNQIRKKENLRGIKLESTLSHQDFEGTGSAQGSYGPIPTTEGMACESCLQHDHDRDIGGGCFDSISIKETGSQYFTIIENVEKDLSPSLIIEFIKKNTRVTAKAYVFPSLFCESYTRVAVVSDRKEEFKTIYNFLSSSDHIIMSSKGRPWVVYENKLRCGTVLPNFASFTPKSQECENFENVLKVVHKGEAEYEMGEKLKNLVMQFLDHQHRLYMSLEERMIVHPFHIKPKKRRC